MREEISRTLADSVATAELRSILHAQTTTRTQVQWRAWSTDLMRGGRLSASLLASLWSEVLDFDPVLADYIASPIELPDRVVLVAGSGKETFKTFNVSTAASILAASAGVPVVKGVAHSVSAVSGSADVLRALGIPVVADPVAVRDAVDADGVGFVSYAGFCPIYASRYDGVFSALNPFSYFMPVAVLAMNPARFVFGLADSNVTLAADALRAVRSNQMIGFVVATVLGRGEVVDESASVGTTHCARVGGSEVKVSRSVRAQPDERWRRAVVHGSNHSANARAVVDALSPAGDLARTELVETNAALIVQANHNDQFTCAEALALVREARCEGSAQRLVKRLQGREDVAVICTGS